MTHGLGQHSGLQAVEVTPKSRLWHTAQVRALEGQWKKGKGKQRAKVEQQRVAELGIGSDDGWRSPAEDAPDGQSEGGNAGLGREADARRESAGQEVPGLGLK